MNKICWFCEKETNIKEDDYGDHRCNFCGVEISVYNPADYQPMPEEEAETLKRKEQEEMKPPKREKTDFEKVVVGEFITGIIEKIEYDNEHKFKGFEGKEDTIAPAVRLVFKLDGYEFAHRSRWMRFNVGEKANLYKKYLVKLVEGITPDADFDIDHLKGMKVKTIWEEKNEFQSIESIFPLEKKIPFTTELAAHEEETQPPEIEEENA